MSEVQNQEAQVHPSASTFSFQLPSKGIYYGDQLPNGDITVKPISAKEEKIFAGSRGSKDNVISKFLKNCIVSDINPDDLLVGDRFYLIFMLRANSYGTEYGFQYQCPSCNLKFRHTIDILDDLDLKETSEEKEPFQVTLPRSGDVISFRLLRGKDEQEIMRYSEKKYKDVGGEDPTYFYRPARSITAINEEEINHPFGTNQVMIYLENLIGEDWAVLNDEMNRVDVGIDTNISVVCPRCSHEEDIDLPFSAEFFRSRRKR